MTAPAGEQQQNAGAGGNGGGQGSGNERTFTQAELNSKLAQERRETEARFEGYDDFKSKAEQFDQLTESTKSELQKANEVAAEMKSKYEASQADNSKLSTKLLRQQIAAEKELPAAMWKRVQGSTKEEIEADVEDLLKSAGSAGGSGSSGSFRSGASVPDGKTDKERAAAALRGVRDR
ncbi:MULTISPECIES: hypothetical protein [Mycolicibacterium]|jgi:hypothetical protein|uniref:Scaffolding protein n=1 Tax=Mycolicibacterium fortuitum TaxID=1766 RepID=A0AAE4VHS5_MYCFO|nr:MULTISPECIES: hypothetical protein [Mycolicibacterium]MDV7194293.1 hypothetical protein [Mycolicibacterium fortuitum]MDV7294288.1 hypothetical protein [Mycolicibacterium fortuitum]MDV7301401.1 hypothetical protein [Mycolicibacterium fortuitum]MDV7323203.1 hypothetical protein [Mycolicibacterium fortuitum]MDV7363547.1 hypothetical protein [Mycolicibacterium fortuitum]